MPLGSEDRVLTFYSAGHCLSLPILYRDGARSFCYCCSAECTWLQRILCVGARTGPFQVCQDDIRESIDIAALRKRSYQRNHGKHR
jgi:hypothetical protein